MGHVRFLLALKCISVYDLAGCFIESGSKAGIHHSFPEWLHKELQRVTDLVLYENQCASGSRPFIDEYRLFCFRTNMRIVMCGTDRALRRHHISAITQQLAYRL